MLGPVVFVAALWSRVGSVQPLRTDPRQKTRRDEQQTVRIIVDLDLQAIVCRLTDPPRVGLSHTSHIHIDRIITEGFILYGHSNQHIIV